MSTGYNKIFWGFIFITFHINLGSIQILPNFIGYMIIYYGIKKLSEDYKVKSLEESSKYCSILIMMAFITLVISFAISPEGINNIYFDIIWMNVFNIVEIMMIYKLLDGSSEVLRVKDNTLYDNYNKISIYIALASIVTVGNTINMIFVSEILGVCIVILALALRGWIIVLARKLHNKLQVV